MPQRVSIQAASRIHFGLLSVEADSPRRFGGAGVMLQEPHLSLSVERAPHTTVTGELAGRATHFIQTWQDRTDLREPVHCKILQAPPQHVGLGLGTQLGMSIAMALDTLFERTNQGQPIDAHERARSVGRGLRSAVGAYGFQAGGMIVELGKEPGEQLGKLAECVSLPSDWHVLLARPTHVQGLAGDAETTAFEKLPPVAERIRKKLRHELFERLLPAAQQGDFAEFSESVYQYGAAAGACFADKQGGPFLNDTVTDFVHYCRQQGVRGVGQSSWGPTVYCWLPTYQAAKQFETQLADANFKLETIVTPIAHSGVIVSQDG